MSGWVKIFPLLMNRVGMATIAKSVKLYQYNFYCISALFASFFVGSGFVGPRTRGLHRLDWVCLILGWVELDQENWTHDHI